MQSKLQNKLSGILFKMNISHACCEFGFLERVWSVPTHSQEQHIFAHSLPFSLLLLHCCCWSGVYDFISIYDFEIFYLDFLIWRMKQQCLRFTIFQLYFLCTCTLFSFVKSVKVFHSMTMSWISLSHQAQCAILHCFNTLLSLQHCTKGLDFPSLHHSSTKVSAWLF